MRTYNGEKSYPCNQCFKAFSQDSDLKRHMRTHTGEKPYPCNKCLKTFSEVGNLKRHSKTHTGENWETISMYKSFLSGWRIEEALKNTYRWETLCMCLKAFSDVGNLKNHLRTHTG